MQVNDMVGYLELHSRFHKNRRAYWNCECTLCGNETNIREDTLQRGGTKSCGCYNKSKEKAEKSKQSHPIEDLTGNVYGDLTVLCLSDKRQGKHILWTCLCSCGRIVDVWSANLKNGNTKTCGDFEAHRKIKLQSVWLQTIDDLTGMVFGDWLVEKRDGTGQPTRWICKCQNCGTVKSVLGVNLKNGTSTSCGCRKYNKSLTGQRIGHWHVGEKSTRLRPNGHYCTNYFCTCDCGTQRYVDESRLLSGKSLSCGCVKSLANEYIARLLISLKVNFATEYKYEDLRGPGNGLLRFDFALLDKYDNVICLIEYQGKQHYIDTDFGRQQREITDEQKKNYCKNNNINLYEIKYDEDITEKINLILTHITS